MPRGTKYLQDLPDITDTQDIEDIQDYGFNQMPLTEQEEARQARLNEEEAEFVAHTNYLFKFEDCVCLAKDGERPLFKGSDFDTPKEANILIEQGYTPIPF